LPIAVNDNCLSIAQGYEWYVVLSQVLDVLQH